MKQSTLPAGSADRHARIALVALAIFATVAVMHLAKTLFVPMVFALVLGIVVSPLADRLQRFGIPPVVIAAALLLATTAVIGAVILLVEPLVSVLIDQLPRIKIVVTNWLNAASGVLRGIEEISQEIESSVGAEDVEPQTAIPSVRDALWLAPGFVSQVFIFVGTLFFFTLTRHDIYKSFGEWQDTLRKAERAVARYFAAVTLVNLGLGIATAIALTLAGVEYAMLWGVAAGILNFILYLGPMIIIAGLAVAGIVQFSGTAALLPPLLFLMLNFVEAYFLTPLVVGKRMALNPLLIFIAIVFGLWLWGPIGAIVALPVLLWVGTILKADGVFGDEVSPRAKLIRSAS